MAGLVATTGVILTTPQKAEAATAYGYSQFEIEDLIIELNGGNGNFVFATEASDFALLNGLVDGNLAPLDPPQAFVSNNVVPPAPQNSFDPYGDINPTAPGPAGPNFSRSDALIGPGTDPNINFDAENVAESYVSGNSLAATANAEWEAVSQNFNLAVGDVISVDGVYNYLLNVVIDGFDPGELKLAEAEFFFSVDLVGQEADGTAEVIRQFEDDEAIGLLNTNGALEDSATIDIGGIGTAFNFAPITAAEIAQFETFNLVIDAVEETVVDVEQAPEPTTVLGLLAVGGLGLGLKRKKQ